MSDFLHNLPVPLEVKNALRIEIREPDGLLGVNGEGNIQVFRDTEGRISSFLLGSVLWLITRTPEGRVSTLSDGRVLRTISRDVEGRVSSVITTTI